VQFNKCSYAAAHGLHKVLQGGFIRIYACFQGGLRTLYNVRLSQKGFVVHGVLIVAFAYGG
jgi:hypothetical protein